MKRLLFFMIFLVSYGVSEILALSEYEIGRYVPGMSEVCFYGYDQIDGKLIKYVGDGCIHSSHYYFKNSVNLRNIIWDNEDGDLSEFAVNQLITIEFIGNMNIPPTEYQVLFSLEVARPSHKLVTMVLCTPTGNVRWEKSTDNGVTWTNIENTEPWYEENDPERGTALYRTLDPDGSYSKTITVHYYDEIPETIVTTPEAVTKSVEESVTFTTDVVDDGYTYQWYHDGQKIEGATLHDYTIEKIFAKDAGNYTCKVTNPVGEVTSSTATLTVNRIAQTITFPEIEAKTYGDADFLLPETTDKGLKIVYTSGNLGVAKITDNTVHIVGSGESIITANQIGSEDYLEAPYVTRKLVVNKRKQAIHFPTIEKKRYGDKPFQLPSTTDEGLTISYKVINPKVATVDGNTVTIHNAGQTEIIASQDGDTYHYEATPVSQTIVVDKANQNITFASIGAKTYGDPSVKLNDVSDVGLPLTYTVEGESVRIDDANNMIIVCPGVAEITASQPGTENYNPATSVKRTVTVSKAPQTIHWDNIPNLTYGDADITLPATTDKGLAIVYASSDEKVAVIKGNILSVAGAGKAEITATQEGDEFYTPASSKTLTVNVAKAYQTITFPAIPELTFGMSPIELDAKSDSSSEVRYESSNVKVATIDGNKLTVMGAGSCHITAYAAGDNNYYEATPVSQEISVAKASQIVTFEELEDLTYGIAPFTLSATSSTGKAMTFKSSNAKIISVNGALATVRGAGSAVLTATQSGDENYNPESVAITVNVNKAPLIVRAVDAVREYGEDNPEWDLAFNGFVNGDEKEELDESPEVSTSATKLSNVGTYELTLSEATDKNYSFITQSGTLTITKAPLIIRPDDASRLYAEANPEFTFKAIGFRNNDTEQDLLSLPALFTDAKVGSEVGAYPIYADGGDARNYELKYEEGILSIEKAPLVAKLLDGSREYGLDNDPDIVFDGFRRNENTSVITKVPDLETQADRTSDTGEYKMTLTGGEAQNYYFTYQYPDRRDYANLTVTKAPLTITAEEKTIKPGEPLPVFTLIYEGFRNNDDENSLDQWPHAEVVGFNGEEGEYPISLSGGQDHNYDYILKDGVLRVDKSSRVNSISSEDGFKVRCVQGAIHISELSQDAKVIIYNASGNIVFSEIYTGNQLIFTPAVSGMYIVTNGNISVKVMI